MPRRKTIAVIAAAALLGALLYFGAWPFVVGGGNMRTFCGSLAKGTPVSAVRDSVRQARYRMSSPGKEGRALIHDSRSFGRFMCEVQFEEERLVSARYRQND